MLCIGRGFYKWGFINMVKFKVKYIGPDAADIRNGEIYEAQQLLNTEKLIGVQDRSGEWCAYPKHYFEAVGENTTPLTSPPDA